MDINIFFTSFLFLGWRACASAPPHATPLNKNEVIKSSILVRFKKIDKKSYVYNNKKNLAKSKFSSIDANIKNVFINENLTPKNKQLFYFANCYRKTNNWKFPWTTNGTIYLREKEGSDAVIIRNVLDLDNLAS